MVFCECVVDGFAVSLTWIRNRYDAGSCLVLCWFSVSSRLVRDRFRFRSRPAADRCAAILAAAMQLSALCLASLLVRIGFAAGLAVADWDWFVFGSLLVHFGSRFARPVVGLVSPCLVRGSLQSCFASCCWFPLLVQWIYGRSGRWIGSACFALGSRLVRGCVTVGLVCCGWTPHDLQQFSLPSAASDVSWLVSQSVRSGFTAAGLALARCWIAVGLRLAPGRFATTLSLFCGRSVARY